MQRLLAIGLVLCAALPAWAGRPLATEDAGILDRGACELESSVRRFSSQDEPAVRGWWVQPGCGIGYDTQLAFGGGRSSAGYGRITEVAFSGKTLLQKLADEDGGLVLAYSVGGLKAPNGGFKHETSALGAVITVPVGPWAMHGNLGWLRVQSAGLNSTTWALALERAHAFGPVDLAAETYGDDRSPAWLQAAARWAVVPEKFHLDASYGVQTSGARPKLLTVGAKLSF